MIKIKGLKEKTVSIGPWKADFVLLIGRRELLPIWCKKNLSKERMEYIEKAGLNDECSFACEGQMLPVDGGGGIIWLKYYDANILVHEITHAAFYMMRAKGVTFSRDSEEAFAYLIEYLFKKLT